MSSLFVAAAVVICVASLELVRRLIHASRQIELPCESGSSQDLVVLNAKQMMQCWIDESLLENAGAEGLASVEIRYREIRDLYRTVPELFQRIALISRSADYGDLVDLAKMIYQLQDALQSPTERTIPALTVLSERMKASKSPRPIGKVVFVRPGELLDTDRMMYLNSGTHVRQPLGVIVFDADGKVMSKAKVLCA
jgi:hypothetical protein